MLDLKDKKILFELDKNARLSDSLIGKRVGLSQQVVNYRVKSLLNKGVIRNFYTVVNSSVLGYSFYKVYFKLQNLSSDTEHKIIDFLVKSKNLLWVGTCDGRWDLSISVLCKNVSEFNEFLREFIFRFSKHILYKDVIIVCKIPHFSRSFLLNKSFSEELMEFKNFDEKIELDNTDEKILSLISTNSRLSFLEISKKLIYLLML